MVADALREGDGLPDSAPICSSEAEDIYLRKPGNRVASSSFSTVDTWEALHPRGRQFFGTVKFGFKEDTEARLYNLGAC